MTHPGFQATDCHTSSAPPRLAAELHATALFIAVTEAPHGSADEIHLFTEIVAAGTHHQVQPEFNPLP
jgi:hypothetical protein